MTMTRGPNALGNVAAALTFGMALLIGAAQGAASAATNLAQVEPVYADWLDAVGAVSTIDSGLAGKVAGRGRGPWQARLQDLTARLDAALTEVDVAKLDPEDGLALKAIRKGISDYTPEARTSEPQNPAARCADARGGGAVRS